ncbi:MAG: transketolase C-terminal domain-containing protein [Deltaproteobacteria bacterium]|nr:transketolase C-terminal domain-containing protein [Deltaproteobacteria bacterium]
MSTSVKPVATRQAFGEALAAVGADHPDVVALDADLSKSTKSELFGKKFPERFFQMGIAEQNMIGVAAGLALSGKIAFCCSFACFLAGRFETIKISVAYAGARVRLVGTHAGVGIGEDGYSQMGLEDIALMRTLPEMVVLQPSDDVETHAMIRWLVTDCKQPAYLRLTRQNLRRLHPEGWVYQPGKLDVLREGTDVAIIASGGPVMNAMDAAIALEAEGLSVAVANLSSIKPIDHEGLCALAGKVKLIVTVEDHNVMGGMGSAVAEVIAEMRANHARVYRHGVLDVFGESGTPESLYAKHRLDSAGIAAVVREQIA